MIFKFDNFITESGGWNKRTKEEVYNIVLNKCNNINYKINSNYEFEYDNNRTKLHLICDKGHEYDNGTFDSFINKNQLCNKCSKTKKSNTEEFIKKAKKSS